MWPFDPAEKKVKGHDGETRCFVWRKRDEGDSGDEWIKDDLLPKRMTKLNIFGERLPMVVESTESGVKKYTPFIINDDVFITPKVIALIPGFKSWQDLNTHIRTIWDEIKPAFPIIAIIVVTIAYVMIRG